MREVKFVLLASVFISQFSFADCSKISDAFKKFKCEREAKFNSFKKEKERVQQNSAKEEDEIVELSDAIDEVGEKYPKCPYRNSKDLGGKKVRMKACKLYGMKMAACQDSQAECSNQITAYMDKNILNKKHAQADFEEFKRQRMKELENVHPKCPFKNVDGIDVNEACTRYDFLMGDCGDESQAECSNKAYEKIASQYRAEKKDMSTRLIGYIPKISEEEMAKCLEENSYDLSMCQMILMDDKRTQYMNEVSKNVGQEDVELAGCTIEAQVSTVTCPDGRVYVLKSDVLNNLTRKLAIDMKSSAPVSGGEDDRVQYNDTSASK
ncbi:hypothetical protein [Bacteriovorax sp. Seq25_V]|uniref:hypothetical protein n=1 Tax=Bacteriovorax sp. Seq25_V TaxID=1201288 RepID=UPI00038A3E81|nr:hypothetical protein [Bacteriovorax sp. Seq25_V]EQC43252.1 hypothetical protein M900_0073 [Bacteriovorax sp. Seq25_V]